MSYKKYNSIYAPLDVRHKKRINAYEKEYSYFINLEKHDLEACDNYYILSINPLLESKKNDVDILIPEIEKRIKENKYYSHYFEDLQFSLTHHNSTRKFAILEIAKKNNQSELNNDTSNLINWCHETREKFIRLIYVSAPDLILNAISAFYEPYQPIIKPSEAIAIEKNENEVIEKSLQRVRFFLPDECTIQVEDTLSRLESDQSPRIEIHENHLSFHQINLETIIYPIICHQKSKGYYTIDISHSHNVKPLFECIQELSLASNVEFVEPSELAHGNYSSTVSDLQVHHRIDKLIESQKFLNDWSFQDIHLLDAWSFSRGKSNTTIAVIDNLLNAEFVKDETGAILQDQVKLLHRAFDDSKITLHDFQSNLDYGMLDSGKAHGNLTAGIVCAIDYNAGYLGVAPKCSVMSLGVGLTYSSVVARVDAINYVVDIAQQEKNKNNHYVINCCWHIIGKHGGLLRAIRKAHKQKNVCIVAASGNFNDDRFYYLSDIKKYPIYPASDPTVITVGASTIRRTIWSQAGFGQGIVDTYAPGENLAYVASSSSKESYSFTSGTSLACPYVSGVIALMWSCAPNLIGSEMKNILQIRTWEQDKNLEETIEKSLPNLEKKGIIDANASIANAIKSNVFDAPLHKKPWAIIQAASFLVMRALRLIYIILYFGIFYRNRTILGTLAYTICPNVMSDAVLFKIRLCFLICVTLGLYQVTKILVMILTP